MEEEEGSADDPLPPPLLPLAQTMMTQTQTQTQTHDKPQPRPQPQPQPQRGAVNAKCDIRYCRLSKQGVPFFNLYKCFETNCEKTVHYPCYDNFVLQKNRVDNPFPNILEAVFCSKTHMLKRVKKGNEPDIDASNTNLQWDKDGKNGPDDPKNSMAVLIDWLTTPGNYAKYKGDTVTGKTKIRVAEEISTKINALGVKKVRTAKAVATKINNLLSTYKKASDWANCTGAGVLEKDGKEPFDKAVSRKFLFFVVICSHSFVTNTATAERNLSLFFCS